MGHWGSMGWGAGMWGMGLLWLLLIAGIALVVVALTRGLPGGHQHQQVAPTPPAGATPVGQTTGPASAQAILDERLARGELDVAEYTERSKALKDR